MKCRMSRLDSFLCSRGIGNLFAGSIERRHVMSEQFKIEEKKLLKLLCAAIGSRKKTACVIGNGCDWEKILQLAQAHAVSAMLYDVLKQQPEFPKHLLQRVQNSCRITVLSNYRLLFLAKYLTALLQEHGITAVTLKGAAAASYYPVPEYRKSGDIDLLVPVQDDYKKACHLLEETGFRKKQSQSALHHTEYDGPDGIVIELHGLLAEPFESRKVNQYLEKLLAEYAVHVEENNAWGVQLYQPADAYHAFYLLLHMLQHFLREGFGLKNLCDWAVFWNRRVSGKDKRLFAKLVKESGTVKFARVLTAACVKYLGLPAEKAAFMKTEAVPDRVVDSFMQEVMDAGEFGKSEGDRMVAMRGTGLMAYIQEFQHQMHLNYPKAGRVFLCWPLLWILTLQRFLANNRRLHRAPVKNILKKAGRRSRLTAQLDLFSVKRR